jgi:hypothetical protein
MARKTLPYIAVPPGQNVVSAANAGHSFSIEYLIPTNTICVLDALAGEHTRLTEAETLEKYPMFGQ